MSGMVRRPNTCLRVVPGAKARGDEEFAALQANSFDFEAHELSSPRSPSASAVLSAFSLHQSMNALSAAVIQVAHPYEPPRLHQPDARREICGGEQSVEQRRILERVAQEMTHIPPCRHDPV